MKHRRAVKNAAPHEPSCGGGVFLDYSRGGILRAARSDGRKNGTSSTPKSFPLRGRCRRRRRKRCRTGSQFVSTDAEAQRKSPLPSSGSRGTPDATLPSRGGILRAVRSDGRRSATKITSPVIRLAGDAGCHPPLKGRDFARSPFPFPDEPCRSPSAFRRTELLLKNGKQFLNYRNILLTNDMKSAMVK